MALADIWKLKDYIKESFRDVVKGKAVGWDDLFNMKNVSEVSESFVPFLGINQMAEDAAASPAPAAEVEPKRGISTFSSLRYRNYRLLWFAQLGRAAAQVGRLGDLNVLAVLGMVFVAIGLYAKTTIERIFEAVDRAGEGVAAVDQEHLVSRWAKSTRTIEQLDAVFAFDGCQGLDCLVLDLG